jgi:Disulphide bond corrector protein DsbC.
MKKAALILALPALVAFSTPTVVSWSATPVRATSRAPGEAMIRVRGNIIDRWHVYSMSQKPGGPKPLVFELEGGNEFSIGPVKGPVPQKAYDAEFKMATETYSGAAEFLIPVRWKSALPAGTTELRLIIRYQACSDKLCLPPRKEALAVEIRGPGSK